MGLMLSILVVCVGVIEALSCYEHFQYGILHCATNIYEHARRRSSVFLNYTSRRLKLLSEDSIAEDDDETSLRLRFVDEPVDDFVDYRPRENTEEENKSKTGKKFAKFEKQDKIDLVKKLLEKPSRPPRASRSISMPERTSLMYSEKDLELTKIINELANEPIDEINVEVEELDNESVIEEFDKLFDENEENLNQKIEQCTTFKPENTDSEKENCLNKPKNNESKKNMDDSIKMIESEVKDNEEMQKKNDIKENSKAISQKISKFDNPVKISRSTSIDLDKVSLLLSKSTSVDSDRPKRRTTPKKLPQINSSHKSPSPDNVQSSSVNIIFENESPELIDKTFEELFSDINEDSLNDESIQLGDIENIIMEALDNETVENLGKEFISSEIAKYIENNKTEIKNQKTEGKAQVIKVSDEKPVNETFLKLLNNLADRIVSECLSEIRNLEINNLKLEILKINDQKPINLQKTLPPQEDVISRPELLDVKNDKNDNVMMQPLADLNSSSNIKLPQANDKKITLENCEKEKLQEPLEERKMTCDNKNQNSTPMKFQLSFEEETTESSGRSSPTGSVVTILSVGSEDSATSKPNDPQIEDSYKISSKPLPLTNESVPALEYKPRVPEVYKENKIITLKWTDQVEKEISSKKDVIEIIKEGELEEQPKAVDLPQNNITSKSTNQTENVPESKSSLVNTEIAESKLVEQRNTSKPLETSNLEKDANLIMIISNLDTEQKPFENQTFSVLTKNEMKNENSQSISEVLPSIEIKQTNQSKTQEKNIPFNENQPQEVKSEENVKKGMIESKDVSPLGTSKAEKLEGVKKVVEAEHVENEVIEKISEVLALGCKEEIKPLLNKNNKDDVPVETIKVSEDSGEARQENNTLQLNKADDISVGSNDLNEGGPRNKNIVKSIEETKSTGKPVSEVPVKEEEVITNNIVSGVSEKISLIEKDQVMAIEYNRKENVKPDDCNKEVIPLELKIDADASLSEETKSKDEQFSEVSVKVEEILTKKIVSGVSEGISLNEKDKLVEKPVLAIKGDTVLALEYKRKENVDNSNQEVIPLEWKIDNDAPLSEKTIEISKVPTTKTPKNLEAATYVPESTQKGTQIRTNESSNQIQKSAQKGDEKSLTESVKKSQSKEEGNSSSSAGNFNVVEGKQTQSAPEAFWLIFSGEYTKAMSKDWHSGHFSCWQCDEALTGQRYVLRDDHPYCIKCYESVFANVCEECNKIIGIDSKDLSYKDKHWHEACFLCNKCRVSLVDKQFGSKADKIYCGNCYDAQFASRCDGCGEIFRAGTKKMEYKTRQWHEKCFCCCVCKTPIGTKSFIPREQEIYCATCYEEKFATRCVKCNKIITSGGVTYKNEPWHRECFTCTNCNTSLAGQRFTSRDEKPYCADCFGELFAKRCTSCSRPITGIGGTRFISFEDRHWHNDCFICASCKTSLVGRGFITDGDDIICPECAKQKLM